MHNFITVLLASQNHEQLRTLSAIEYQDSEPESDSELSISSEENKEPTSVNSSLLLQNIKPA